MNTSSIKPDPRENPPSRPIEAKADAITRKRPKEESSSYLGPADELSHRQTDAMELTQVESADRAKAEAETVEAEESRISRDASGDTG